MMSRATKVKVVCAALLGVVVILAGLFWYFRVYTKTPEYALRSVESALDQHDEPQFLRYVRLDSILDSGYDDFMAGTMEAEFGHSRETSTALEDFSRMLKPAFIKMLRDALDTRLKTGEWPSADAAQEGADAENILSRIGVRDLSLREIANLTVDEEAQTALADVVTYQEEADSNFTFKISLAPSEEGDWQVVSIENLHEYAVFLGKSRRLRVEAYLEALLRPGYGFTVYWGQGLLEIRQLGIWHARSWNKISFQTGRNAVRNLQLSLFRGRCRVCTNSVLRYVICTLHTPKAMLRG